MGRKGQEIRKEARDPTNKQCGPTGCFLTVPSYKCVRKCVNLRVGLKKGISKTLCEILAKIVLKTPKKL